MRDSTINFYKFREPDYELLTFRDTTYLNYKKIHGPIPVTKQEVHDDRY